MLRRMKRSLSSLFAVAPLLVGLVVGSCAPARTSYATFPNAPATFDRAGSDPKALELADQVFAAAGGPGNWDKAKQIRWNQTVTSDGKVLLEGEHAWDRWNARHFARLHKPDGNIKVGYQLYGSFAMGFMESDNGKTRNLDDESRERAVKVAKEAFNVDTAVMSLQFLLFEPGAKLSYVGPVRDDAGNEAAYDDLQVVFADPLRENLEFHAIVDHTSHLIVRVEMMKPGVNQKVGYTLKDWTTVNGLKFATARTNLGYSGETTAIKDVKVSEPEDTLFITPL
ncbi:MAG: hypothetical protein H6Q90_3565 [Deltaproteobacteria bacterium]|nr:hypothetical protein [Deltaproteobacteria bacterium]